MTELVGWLLVVLIGCGVYVGVQSYLYPGGWAYAFGSSYADERRTLAGARRGDRVHKRKARQAMAEAEGQLSGARSQYKRRIRTAERALEAARNPGSGEQVKSLGALTLHRHTLRVGKEEIPLARLKVRLEHSGDKSHLYLTRPSGKVHHEVLQGEEYEDVAVRKFAVAVQNEVVKESKRQKGRKEQVVKREAEVEQARADTAPQELATRRVADLAERQRADPDAEAARLLLEAARERWHSFTHHWPR
jgi:hypothetical protein